MWLGGMECIIVSPNGIIDFQFVLKIDAQLSWVLFPTACTFWCMISITVQCLKKNLFELFEQEEMFLDA